MKKWRFCFKSFWNLFLFPSFCFVTEVGFVLRKLNSNIFWCVIFNMRLLLKPLHCNISLLLRYKTVLLRQDDWSGFCKISKDFSSIKGSHVYQRKLDIGEKLNCVLDVGSRHSNTAIKVVCDGDEMMGHMPEKLSEMIVLILKTKSY